MVDFNQTWKDVTEAIASGERTTGIPRPQVRRIAFEKKLPMAAPYILVAMIPGVYTASISGAPLKRRATVEVFCAVAGDGSMADRIGKAVDVGFAVMDIIATLEPPGLEWPDSPCVLDSIDAGVAVVNVQFVVQHG